MMLEARTSSPEMVDAQSVYKKAFYDRFALMGLTPEYASLEVDAMEQQGFVPTVEFMVRFDSLPPSLQTLVGNIQGFFPKFRVVMGLHRAALIATNSDGTRPASHVLYPSEADNKLVTTGHEIAFDVDDATHKIARTIFEKGGTYGFPLGGNHQAMMQGLEPKVIEELAGLIGRDSEGTNSKVTIYHRQHPDLPSTFRTGSPSS